MVVGLVQLYDNPAAPSDTIALTAVVSTFGSIGYFGWRKVGRA